jgi:hypothetical protein
MEIMNQVTATGLLPNSSKPTPDRSSDLSLSASDLTRWQTCRRRWLLERHWKIIRRPPKLLFDSCLREGIFQLSNGADVATVRSNARTRFLSEAANPGLDMMSGDPWTVAQDWAGMLGVILTAISRLVLLTLARPQTSLLDGMNATWFPLSWIDDSGTLHRWRTGDSFDDETLAREAHSWSVIGDMVMLDSPMMLHAIDIGSQRQGRRHSPWARCYKHPIIAGQFRFQRPDGKGGWRKLSGDKWSPLWYADQTKPDPEAWCNLMDADHVTPSLLHHISISQPSAMQTARIRAELAQVCREMMAAVAEHPEPESPMAVPMARSACDPVGGPCPWQQACFREQPERGIDALGLYQLRGAPGGGRSSPEPQPPSSRPSYDSVAASYIPPSNAPLHATNSNIGDAVNPRQP